MVKWSAEIYLLSKWRNQLQPLHKAQVGKGKVLVRRYLNGELHFCYGGRDLPYTLLPERPKPKTVDKMKNKNRLGLAEPKATSDQK